MSLVIMCGVAYLKFMSWDKSFVNGPVSILESSYIEGHNFITGFNDESKWVIAFNCRCIEGLE